MLKAELRKQLRALRQELSADTRRAAANTAARLFIATTFFQKAAKVACYWAQPEEMDTLPLIQALWAAGKHCYLPVMLAKGPLEFALYKKGDTLQANRYGVLEPQTEAARIAAAELDLVILPLVAFDAQGNRLGMGGGSYDRSFEFLLQQKERKPLLVGLAYRLQEVAEVPRESFDVPLAAVLTEFEFRLLGSNRGTAIK